MENMQFSTQIKTRKALRCGTRAVLILEGESPAGDTPLSCHVRALFETLSEHAAREYLPGAADELQVLSLSGRGYDFLAHRLHFCAVARTVKGRVLLELSAVDFMDSSGLGLIMGRYALVKQYGGTLAVLDPSPAVLKIIRLAGMERMVSVLRTKGKNEEHNK